MIPTVLIAKAYLYFFLRNLWFLFIFLIAAVRDIVKIVNYNMRNLYLILNQMDNFFAKFTH